VRKAPRRRRRDHRHEAFPGEPASPRAENARGEAPLTDNEPRAGRWIHEQGFADRIEREVPERPAAVPALEALTPLEPLGLPGGVEGGAQQSLEPGNTPEPVSMLAGGVGLHEVADDDRGIPWVEPAGLESRRSVRSEHGFDPIGGGYLTQSSQ
jgi:hypothetical protein